MASNLLGYSQSVKSKVPRNVSLEPTFRRLVQTEISYCDTKHFRKGRGSVRVYEGKWNQQEIALKIFYALDLDFPEACRILENLKKIQHENILKIFDITSVPQFGQVWMVLELGSISFNDCVEEKKYPIPKLDMLNQATRALEYLHRHGIPHGNITPTNFILSNNDDSAVVKLAEVRRLQSKRGESSSQFTAEQNARGWLSPEVLNDLLKNNLPEENKSADVFPLGCIFYYMLTDGTHPFGDVLEREKNIVDINPLPALRNRCCEKDCISVNRGMLANDPEERPSCAEILENVKFWSCAVVKEINENHKILTCAQNNLRGTGKIKYDISQFINSGGGGSVYKGFFGDPPRTAAIKVVRVVTDAIKREIKKEIDFNIDCGEHPNIVEYFYKEEFNDEILIAFELCNLDLEQFLKSSLPGSPTIPFQTTLQQHQPIEIGRRDIINQIAMGLDFLHKKNIVHLDLKPRNVLLKQTGFNAAVKITDFGISKYIGRHQDSVTITSAAGTNGWMAPEILDFIDSRRNKYKSGSRQIKLKMKRETDVFSLGCIFYYVLTNGDHPFGSEHERNSKILCDQDCMNTHHADLHVRCNIPFFRKMISSSAHNRPSTSTVLKNPIFWSYKKMAQFLAEVYDFAKITDDLNNPDYKLVQECIDNLEGFYGKVITNFQGDQLQDNKLFLHLHLKRKFKSFKDLLHIFRNFKTHYHEDKEMQDIVRPLYDEFMEDWLSIFPCIVQYVWEAFSGLGNHETLKSYY